MRKCFLYLLMFVCSLIVVTATLDNNDFLAVWDFQNNSINDNVGSNDATIVSNGLTITDGCINGNCRYFDGTGDYIVFTENSDILLGETKTWTWWGFYNSSQVNSAFRLFQAYDTGANNAIGIYHTQATNVMTWQTKVGVGCNDKIEFALDIDDDTWHFFVLRIDYEQNNKSVFVDGVHRGSSTGLCGWNDTAVRYTMMATDAPSLEARGIMDEFYVHNKALTEEEMNETRYSYFPYGGAPVVPTPSMSLTQGYPLNNTQHIEAQNFYFNGTVTASDEIVDCEFYVNEVNYQNLTSINITQNHNFSYTWNSNYFNYSINCSNSNSSDYLEWTNITIDTIEPYINITYPTNGISIDYTTNFYHNISLNDTNLDGYNISYFINNSGALTLQQTFYADNMNGGLEVLYNITNSSDWCSSPPCEVYLNVTSWDSHNPIESEHEKYKDLFNEDGVLTFFFEGGYITLQSNKTENYFVYDEDNKYKIEFGFSQKKDIDLFITSNKPFYFKGTSNYRGHFVFPTLLKYFDLEGDGITITSINKTITGYQIIFDSEKDKIKTESIGDLHISSVNRQFTLYELPSLSDTLLTDINQSLTNVVDISESIEGGILMIGLAILIVVFLVLGVFTPIRIFVSFAGLMFLLLSFVTGDNFINGVTQSTSDKLMFFTFLFLGLGVMILGIVLQILHNMDDRKQKTKDFYSSIY